MATGSRRLSYIVRRDPSGRKEGGPGGGPPTLPDPNSRFETSWRLGFGIVW
jgi:hypothetical protein